MRVKKSEDIRPLHAGPQPFPVVPSKSISQTGVVLLVLDLNVADARSFMR